MESYQAYDLTIVSEIPLPAFPGIAGKQDISIRYHPIDYPPEAQDQETRFFQKAPDGILLSWPKHVSFFLKNGSEVWVQPRQGCDQDLIKNLLLGPVISTLLIERSMPVFHASTLSFQGKCAGFLAAKGHGKSTQAAALVKRGAQLVSDDVLALKFSDRNAWALPGFQQIKLWPDSLEILGEEPEDHPRITADLSKRTIAIPDDQCHASLPLNALYILQYGYTLEIRPLNKLEALRLILPHWYGALFQGALLPIFGLDRHFSECVSLLEKVPVFLFKRPPALDQIEKVCQAIECHILENNS